jgi:propanol-preferring alcohol dehydrogenase
MKAMVLSRYAEIEERPLELKEIAVREPGEGEIVVKVCACGVCHTELDEIEGRLECRLPVVPGHQIVGVVEKCGAGCKRHGVGERVGSAWIYWSCGKCEFCMRGSENLCPNALWTGKDVNGGYAQYFTVNEDFAYKLPANLSDEKCAPLLCAGIIGYRAMRLSGLKNGESIGLFGFGASAHILIKIIQLQFPDSKVFVLTRGEKHRQFARELGAFWAGSGEDEPGEKLDRIIDFTPAGEVVARAMELIKPGGRVVINAIRKVSPVPAMDYGKYLWMEKEMKSTANVTRQDAVEFLELAGRAGLDPTIEVFGLEEANEALIKVKSGQVHGAAVLRM